MNHITAEQEITATRPFHFLYVRKSANRKRIEATYLVRFDGDGGEEMYARTVDVTTQEPVSVSYSPRLSEDAKQLLDLHFTDEYVAHDGLILMQELCADYGLYADTTLTPHPVYGACIFYADLDEVYDRDAG